MKKQSWTIQSITENY